MREIKFRALTNCNVMVYGFYVYDEHLKLHYIDTGKGVRVEINTDTLGQYTGLKDKNEEEIYEGDIVEIGDFRYSIKFEIGSFMLVRCSNETDMYTEFDNCWNDDVYPLCQLHWESNADENKLFNCEIIGNIYKNSELVDA